MTEIPEWEKDNYIQGVKITTDNLFDFILEHVSENNIPEVKRDLTENEKKLDYYVSGWMDNLKRGFKNLESDISIEQYKIISLYTELKETEQYRASEELNNQMTRYKRKITRITNKLNLTVKFLIDYVKRKSYYTEELLFLQELNDLFDEIRFGHVSDYDYDYIKIAGFGYYRNKRIESKYPTNRKSEIARIHQIINNPKEAKTSEQIYKENHEYFEKAKKESKQFVIDNIKQREVKTDDNSYLDRDIICVHCNKEFKSRNTRLSFGKQVANIVKHLKQEHQLTSQHSWNIKRILEEQI